MQGVNRDGPFLLKKWAKIELLKLIGYLILKVLYMDIKLHNIGLKIFHSFRDIQTEMKKVSLFTPFYGIKSYHKKLFFSKNF